MLLPILYWILLILYLVALFFGSGYPMAITGLAVVLFIILGIQVFGSPLARSGPPPQ